MDISEIIGNVVIFLMLAFVTAWGLLVIFFGGFELSPLYRKMNGIKGKLKTAVAITVIVYAWMLVLSNIF